MNLYLVSLRQEGTFISLSPRYGHQSHNIVLIAGLCTNPLHPYPSHNYNQITHPPRIHQSSNDQTHKAGAITL